VKYNGAQSPEDREICYLLAREHVRDIPLGGGEAEGRLLKSLGYRF